MRNLNHTGEMPNHFKFDEKSDIDLIPTNNLAQNTIYAFA